MIALTVLQYVEYMDRILVKSFIITQTLCYCAIGIGIGSDGL